VALHLESAVAPLLLLARIALGEPWTQDTAREALFSRAIGLDPSSIRRLLRLLLREERSGGGARTGGVLLVDALADPARWATIPGRESTRAALVAQAVSDGMAVAKKGATAGGVLWAIWKRLGVAEAWREEALDGSTEDDADLDVVVALFEAARRHAERLPDASPESFFDFLEGQAFAVDTLAAKGALDEVISFETPASAAGREWEAVAIAGLDEGTWPNLRLRDSVFGSVLLQEVLSGRAAEEPVPAERLAEVTHAARADVLADETRALLVAFSRARGRVIALCRDGGDDRPSRYAAWIDGSDHCRRHAAGEVGGIPSLREAVIALRAEAEGLSSADRKGHVAMVARLALARVPGADPGMWHGVSEPSSRGPLWREDETVRVSPSKVERIESCPLRAVLESAGGTRESGQAQRLGTLIHAIAAEHPHGSANDLKDALDLRWPELGLPENWLGDRERLRADGMVARFVDYAARIEDEGWEVETERPFRVEVGRAVLSGRADRLHVKEEKARIVDLKTSRYAISKDSAQDNPQLAMYQVAAGCGGFPGVTGTVGAELVFLGYEGDPVRVQDPVDGDVAVCRLGAIVDTLSSASFEAVTSDDCRTCPVKRSCPAWPEGGRVSGS